MRKNSKKIFNAICCFSGLLALLAYINEKIFENSKIDTSNEKFYNHKFGNMRYKKHGKGAPILLIHDTVSHSGAHEWNESIRLLSKTNTVYAIDLLGYGLSDKPNVTYNGYFYTVLIKDFIENIIGEPTTVIASGNSGNFVIMANAFSNSIIKNVILVSPKNIGDIYESPSYLNKALGIIINTPIIGTSVYNFLNSKIFLNTMEKYYFDDSKNSKFIEASYFSAHHNGANSRYSMASHFYSNFFMCDTNIHLKSFKKNIHVIWGIDDDINSINNFGKIENVNGNVTLSALKNVKSYPHLEVPKQFVKICVNKIKSIT